MLTTEDSQTSARIDEPQAAFGGDATGILGHAFVNIGRRWCASLGSGVSPQLVRHLAGSLLGFSSALIDGFSLKDVVGVANINAANALLSYAGSASTGVLTVTDGSQTAEIYLSRSLSGGGFHVAPDETGGAAKTA